MVSYRLLQLAVVVPILVGCLYALPVLAADPATKPPIADAVIDPDRARTPAGKLTIAVHVSLSPKWLNPQETSATMAYELLWKVHDSAIKAMQGNLYTYALAEFYDMSPDFKTATVRLRPGLKFHNGDPVTAEDVQFSYENYHGMSAAYFQHKTERVEVVDGRTVRFHFKEPVLDFLQYYGTTASAAGLIQALAPTSLRVKNPALRWSFRPILTTGARSLPSRPLCRGECESCPYGWRP